jgi:transposase
MPDQNRKYFIKNSNPNSKVMTSQEQKRKVISELLDAGNSTMEIIRVTKYPVSTVYRVVKRLQSGIGVNHTPCGPHKAKKRTPTFLAGLKRSIMAHPDLSISRLATIRGVGRSTVQRAVKNDLGLSSYVRGRRHLLTEAMKVKRLERAQKLKRICKVKTRAIRLFSDESIFTVDACYNPQNNRWLAKDKGDVPPVMKTKHPAKVMVFGLIASDGQVMPAHIFPPKTRLNAVGYLKLLEKVVMPWINRTYPPGTKFMWIQDSAPPHIGKKVMEYLNNSFEVVIQPKDWPSNSPDCNPLDYWL